jgi:hypothetical protein
MTKAAFNKKKARSTGKLDLHLKKKLAWYIWRTLGMVQKIGHFGKQLTNTWDVSRCGAGEGWI